MLARLAQIGLIFFFVIKKLNFFLLAIKSLEKEKMKNKKEKFLKTFMISEINLSNPIRYSYYSIG